MGKPDERALSRPYWKTGRLSGNVVIRSLNETAHRTI
jgi:hypothetical protein